MKKETKETTIIFANGEVADIFRHGTDDYSIYLHNGDCSVRGSYLDIIEEIKETENYINKKLGVKK